MSKQAPRPSRFVWREPVKPRSAVERAHARHVRELLRVKRG